MNELNVLVMMRAKPNREADLRKSLAELVGPSRIERGNLGYDLYEDTADTARFVLVERWASPEDQQRHHKDSAHIQAFHATGDADVQSREIVMVLERLA